MVHPAINVLQEKTMHIFIAIDPLHLIILVSAAGAVFQRLAGRIPTRWVSMVVTRRPGLRDRVGAWAG